MYMPPLNITLFIGSFKPPHKGHLSLVEIMLKKTSKVLVPGGEKGRVYIIVSSKEREPCEEMDGDVAKEVWLRYLETLPVADQARVRVIVSRKSSPVLTAMGLVRGMRGSKIYVIKSAKNVENRRYAMFEKVATELVLPGWENLHSTDMRRALAKKDKKGFMMYVPSKLGKKEKNALYDRLVVLCRK